MVEGWEVNLFNLKILIHEYCEVPENVCGGNLHIVIDDQNLDDGSIVFCYKQCKEAKDYMGMLICSLLIQIDTNRRYKAFDWQGFEYENQINHIDIMGDYYDI